MPKASKKNKKIIEDRFSHLLEQLNSEHTKAQDAENMNQALVASIGEGVIVINEYGIVTQVNSSALQMLGYKEEELLNRWFPEVLPGKDKNGRPIPASERLALQSLLTGHPVSGVVIYTRVDGTEFPAVSTNAPFVLNGRPRGVTIVFRDFSHETAVDQAKDEFVSLASHQLRTPLTTIMLYTKLLKDNSEIQRLPEVYQQLTKIEGSALGMLELIGDFLNLSRLELGHLDIRISDVNVQQLIEEQIESTRAILNDNKITLDFKHPKKPLILHTDKALLTQVIHNFLTNAIRYRNLDDPKIIVELKCRAKHCLVFVQDNGIGIPEESKDKIFSRLYRADNAAKAQSGTGLGLYLVKKIIEALDGEVGFTSEENKGTTFFLKLPS